MSDEKKYFSSLMVNGEKRYVKDEEAQEKIESLQHDIDSKQDLLTPGNNITIEKDSEGNTIISASNGTIDYNELINKPSINNVVLEGSLSLEDLGIQGELSSENAGQGINIFLDSEGKVIISNTQTSAEWGNITGDINDQTDLVEYIDNHGGRIDSISVNGIEQPIDSSKNVDIEVPTKTSDLINNTNFISDANYVHTDNNFTSTEKTKLNSIESGAEVNKIDTVQVNDVSLTINNKTVNVPVPTATSDLTNDSGFITNTVNNLTNYYLKSETYTQAEVNSLIGAITTLNIQVVEQLPTTDISTTTIYFVHAQTSEENNIYDEYVYVNNSWELIGTTKVDLSDYYTKSEVGSLFYNKTETDDLLEEKQDTLIAGDNITITQSSGVPNGYTELSSITSHAAEWIDTGVKLTNNFKSIIVGRVPSTPTNNFRTVLGAVNNNFTTGKQNVLLGWATGGWYIEPCNIPSYVYSTYPLDTNTHTFITTVTSSASSINIDGVINSVTSTPSITNVNLSLFGRLGADGNATSLINFELNSVQLYQSNVLVFNGTPAKRNSDGEIGLYETITNTFLTNAGTEAFTAGDEVPAGTVISATDTTYTAGSGIDITNNMISITENIVFDCGTSTRNV